MVEFLGILVTRLLEMNLVAWQKKAIGYVSVGSIFVPIYANSKFKMKKEVICQVLQTVNLCFTFRVPNFIGSILLPLPSGSHMPGQSYNFLILHKFLKQNLLMMDLERPVLNISIS